MLVSTPQGTVLLVDLPLACCGLESTRMALEPATVDDPIAVVACISGTVTSKLAPAVAARVEQVQQAHPDLPVFRVAVGACACSGGPYWDSPSVAAASTTVGPIDLQVPGCPPSPTAIADAVLVLIEQLSIAGRL